MTVAASRIEDWLILENRTITLRWLCSQLEISQQEGIQLLEMSILRYPRSKAIYSITGKSGDSFHIRLVEQQSLEEMKAYFDSVLDVMPYAIFPDDGLSLDIMTRKIAAANMECYLKKATLLQTNAKSDKNPSEQKVSGVAAVKSLSDMFDAKKKSAALNHQKSLAFSKKMNDSAEIIDIEGDEKKPAEKKVKVAAASFQKKKPAEKLPVERPDVTMAFLQEDAFSSDMMLNEEEELLRDHALMKDLQFDLEEEDASTKNTEGFSIKEKIQPISQKFPAVTSQVDLLSMPMSHSAATLLGEKRHKKKWVKVQKQSFKNGYLVTEMVNEQVSDTDDELPPVAPREVERTKEVTLKSKSVVSGPSRASNSGGQGSLFSFFKKQ